MAPRAQWNGYLKLSLVSCPISLYPAISAAEKVSFRQVNRETGHRLRQQLVDSVTGEVVGTENKGRGYEVAENHFVVVPDEELGAAQREARTRPFSSTPAATPPQAERRAEPEPQPKPRLKIVGKQQPESEPEPEPVAPPKTAPVPRPIIENTRTIELDRFLERGEIDPVYYNTPYYIAPRDEVGLEAYAVIRDAMTRMGLVGMGRVVLANRERPIMIEPMGMGLRGITLRYAHEVRSATEYFAGIDPLDLPEDVVEMTEYILSSKKEAFDPAYLEDRYRTVLVEKLRAKQVQVPARETPRPSTANVVNLMDALKRSLAEQKPPAPSRSKAGTTRKAVQPAKKPAAKGTKPRGKQ